MKINYVFNGLNFSKKIRKDFQDAAKDIGNKVSDLDQLVISVKKLNIAGLKYNVGIKAYSKGQAMAQSLDSENIIKGLAATKNLLIKRIREENRRVAAFRNKKTEKFSRSLRYMEENFEPAM